MASPLFSVLVNNYNYARYVGDAIKSVCAQTCQDFELIVVDDGSKDNSVEVIREAVRPLGERAIVIEKENGGQASAMNAAAERARGKYWAFMDSDDLWQPEKLEIVRRWFRRCPKAVFVQHHLRILMPDGSFGGLHPKTQYQGWALRRYRRTQGLAPFVPTSGITARASLIRDVFPIEGDFRVCADLPLTRIGGLLGETRTIRRVLGHYRVHDANNWFSPTRQRDPETLRAESRAIINPVLVAAGLEPVGSVEELGEGFFLRRDEILGRRLRRGAARRFYYWLRHWQERAMGEVRLRMGWAERDRDSSKAARAVRDYLRSRKEVVREAPPERACV